VLVEAVVNQPLAPGHPAFHFGVEHLLLDRGVDRQLGHDPLHRLGLRLQRTVAETLVAAEQVLHRRVIGLD
jgi:hypothetical protein